MRDAKQPARSTGFPGGFSMLPQLGLVAIVLSRCMQNSVTAEWVSSYRDFDFNASQTVTSKFRIATHQGRFIVKEIETIDQQAQDAHQAKFGGSIFSAEIGDQVLAIDGELVSTLSFREILRQPAGRFMLPLVEQDADGSAENGWQVLRWLRLEIVEPSAITFRPLLAARQARLRRALSDEREKEELSRSMEETAKQAQRKRELDNEEAEKERAKMKREIEAMKHAQQQLKVKQEMDEKAAVIEEAEKARAENGFKREQQRKTSQQRSVAENQQKAKEINLSLILF